MRLRTIARVLTTALMLVSLSTGAAAAAAVASTAPTEVQLLAQQQTNLLLKFYEGQNVSPPKCGQGQSPNGVDGVFLLPVLSFAAGDATLNCKISARAVLVDLGGAVITEDNRFPESSWELNGQPVPFSRENLEPICDDLIARGFVGSPVPATLDGSTPITGPPLNSGVFSAQVNREAQVPGQVDLYADSVALGHPGRLATVFCGAKAIVNLQPGSHRIVVDYSGFFSAPETAVFTYNITVKG